MTTNPKSLKLWFVCMDFPAQSEHFLSVEVAEIVKQGMSVEVVTFRQSNADSGTLAREWNVADVPVDEPELHQRLEQLFLCLRHPILIAYLCLIAVLGIRHRWRKIPAALACCPRSLQIAKRAIRDKPDVIHLGWGHYPSMIGIALRWLNAKQFWSADLSDYALDVRFKPSLLAFRDAAFVRVISTAACKEAEEFGVPAAKLKMIPRGQDVASWVQATGPTQTHRLPKRILTTARLDPIKRIDLCLEVLQSLNHDGDSWELHIAGGGPLLKSLERKSKQLGVSGAATFLGHLSPRELRQEAWEATYFLLLSDSESLPNGLKEAMAAKCLCVASRTAGIEQLLRDEQHGFLVPTDDVPAAVAAIERGQEPVQRERMTSAAREHVLKEFNVEETVSSLVQLWHQT